MAGLDRPHERHRRGHRAHPAHRRGDHRAAAPPAAARPPARRARPAQRGPARRAADRELAPRRVRGAGRGLRAAAARSSTSTSPRGGRRGRRRPASFAGRALRLRGRLPRAEAVPAGRAAHVVRRHRRGAVDHPAPRRVRARAAPVRPADGRADRALRARDGRGRPRLLRPRGRRRDPRRASPTTTTRATSTRPRSPSPAQLEAGYTTFCFKPSMYTDDPAEVPALCRRLVARVEALR